MDRGVEYSFPRILVRFSCFLRCQNATEVKQQFHCVGEAKVGTNLFVFGAFAQAVFAKNAMKLYVSFCENSFVPTLVGVVAFS